MDKKIKFIVFCVVFIFIFPLILGAEDKQNIQKMDFSYLTLINRTSYSDIYYNETGKYYISRIFPRKVNIKNLSGEYEPYENVTDLVLDNNDLILRWNNKSVKFEIYTKNENNKKEKFRDKSDLRKQELNFKTNIQKNKGLIYYNHTLNKEKQPLIIGYDILTENVTCFSENYALICDEQFINFEEAFLKQNLSLILTNNNIEFTGDNLNYIDPSITLSETDSYTRGCWEEKDSSGNIIDYDCTTETGGTDEIRVGWRGYSAQSGYAGENHKAFVGFNISSINSSWTINSMIFNYYPDSISDPSHDNIILEELSQTDFLNGFSSTVDLTPDDYSESEKVINAIGDRNEYGSDVSPYENQYNEINLQENFSQQRFSVDKVNSRYFYVAIRSNAVGLYDDDYYIDIDDDDSTNPPELIISYTPPDTTAPETDISATSPPGVANYIAGTITNNSVQVTLSCSDTDGSGCKSSYPRFCTDISNTCSPLTVYTSPITISTGGISYIRTYSKDNANNTETIDYVKMIIDKNYTQNVSMYVNNIKIWNYTNYFAMSETTNNFTQELNNALENCVEDSEGYCNIPITIHSDSTGKINLSNIDIYFNITEYNWNISNLPELSNYKVRVKATDGHLNSSWDQGDEDFTIQVNNMNSCTTLNSPNTKYTLGTNIINNTLTSSCIKINAQNITLDCAGYYIQSDDGVSGVYSNQINTIIENCNISMGADGSGIYLIWANNSIIKNNILNNQDTGLYFVYSNNLLIENNEMNNNDFTGISISYSSNNQIINSITNNNSVGVMSTGTGTENNTFINLTVYNNGKGMHFGSGSHKLTNVKINNSISTFGLVFFSGDNNVVKDSSFFYSNFADINIIETSLNNTFINCSYGTEDVEEGSELIRKGHYRSYVNDSSGNPVSNANITAYNSSGHYQFNLTTNSSGWTPLTEIIDYINDSGVTHYYSNYTITATNITFSDSHAYNVTLEQNNLEDVFTLGKITLPDDPHKFYHKDSSDNVVAWFGDSGNIVLKGHCYYGGNCNNPGVDSLIFRNSSDSNVAYINSTGDLCIIKGDCSDDSASCNPSFEAFIIRNSTDSNMSYIDFTGDLCLVGDLYENADL